MDYAKFENFQEFYDAVEMGLDIEFFIDGIRYNISWQKYYDYRNLVDTIRNIFP